jgi:hypothetical protein
MKTAVFSDLEQSPTKRAVGPTTKQTQVSGPRAILSSPSLVSPYTPGIDDMRVN